MTVYDTCVAAHGNEDLSLVMKCVSNWIETITATNNESSNSTATSSTPSTDSSAPLGIYVDADEFNSWLLTIFGAMVWFMQAGFAMVCAGAIRKKNVNNTMIKNLLDACGAGISFYMFGYAFAYGNSGSNDTGSTTFVGSGNFFLIGENNDSVDPAFWFFQYAFCATAVTIVAGTLAERCKMASYFCYSTWLSGFVYPVIVHNFWSANGLFSPSNPNSTVGMGMVDFSGSGVIHVTGGITALYAAYILGARRGRFHDQHGRPLSRPGLTKGHSVALQMLGTMILWFCWYAFNAGSALLLPVEHRGHVAARAAVNTTLGAASGALSAMIFNGILMERRTGEFNLDITMCMNGCLSGLVAITAGCGVIDHWAAIFVGVIAGIVYIAGDAALIAIKIDDAVAAIPVHLGNGLWGILATGLFAVPDHLLAAYDRDSHPGLFYAAGGPSLLPAQIVGLLFIIAWTFATMMPFFVALDYLGWFRVNELEELVGLDATYSGNSVNNDDDASDEELRLKAYRQRFEERKLMREKKPTRSATVNALLNESYVLPEAATPELSNDLSLVPEQISSPMPDMLEQPRYNNYGKEETDM